MCATDFSRAPRTRDVVSHICFVGVCVHGEIIGTDRSTILSSVSLANEPYNRAFGLWDHRGCTKCRCDQALEMQIWKAIYLTVSKVSESLKYEAIVIENIMSLGDDFKRAR